VSSTNIDMVVLTLERERDRERARNQTNLGLEITMDHSLKVAK